MSREPISEVTMNGPRPRVIIVDDHPLFRAGVRQRLADYSHDVVVVGEAGSGEDAVDLVDTLEPDVVLMDISMPGMNGLEATRAIKQRHPRVAVLVLTVYNDTQYVVALLDAGAAGYLLKTVEVDQLTRAILDVACGDAVLDPLLSRDVLGGFARDAHEEAREGLLSPRELQVLRLAAGGASNKQIACTLAVSVRTVHTHVSHVLAKLGVGSRTEAVVQGLRRGWLELDDLP
jgi:DNA-binding NarL/FixJ family response regulator